ncbi:hypothetical protein GY45DRAFT_1323016 [Cubamyces sp. BRFM 1775]|nr:hypothetical protein GY45DRAFT_1323016 [Cubamyces sp. BRFM 1775]
MIVVAVTWKYAGMSRAIRNVQGSVPSMVQVMVLNGTIYFLALVILNALHLSITLLAFPLNTGAAGEVLNSVSQVTIFTDPITVVLLCRFLLDLQSTNTRLLEHDVSTSQLDENGNIIGGTLRFATVVADSMGGTIAPDTIENMMHDDTGNGWE